MGTLFRPARQEDAAALAELCAGLGASVAPEEASERLAGLASDPRCAILVAEERARVCGWVQVAEEVSLAGGPSALVVGLVVEEASRGTGIGRGLLRAAEEWASARGLTEVRLRARQERTGAHAFYRRLGYEVRKTQVVFGRRLVSRVGSSPAQGAPLGAQGKALGRRLTRR